jgi:hypothetical protein
VWGGEQTEASLLDIVNHTCKCKFKAQIASKVDSVLTEGKIMKFRKSLLAALCVASLGLVSVPMTASAASGIYLNFEPPPARVEAVPAPRRGYLWAPGYWNAKGNRHVWQAGHWERERTGYYFTQPTWTQRDNRWQLERGRWNRGDRDRDGVPNTVDRAPNDPTRR